MSERGALLYFEDGTPAALRLADAAELMPHLIKRHRFPDGEIQLTLPAHLPPRVVLLRSLHQPGDKLTELLLAAPTARQLGAQHLSLVAPYLAYMRQDMAFAPGQAISQRIVGAWLATLFDAVITVDPHLHRVATLAEAVPAHQAITLSAAPLLGDWIAQHRPGAFLLGPDSESAQWVTQAASAHGLPHAVCSKVRHSDHAVSITLPPCDLRGQAVVLLDDVASSGHTLATAASLALAAGAASVDVAVTHALLAGDALQRIHQAGVGEFWSTDSVAHPSNVVGLAALLAGAIMKVKSDMTEPFCHTRLDRVSMPAWQSD
ncbi:ribose-phosphate diphosphokinase [Limnohabitans parvus]|uniref:Phosphoribosylpyrophosphate synthetase n=1 Tax=Limnohabitans parvus II-B4 TaxID=1293052 RepID=A0A315E907_9BURK|nr:ribose-phosphate diphosphokinase [Limnohabitans parvus]PUE54416.1 phosphoribosylpyrophosphate synthetase [Limnohabitans parvus II-B4]